MDVAFILDPLPELRAYKDSSIAMMRALAKRGHRLFAMEQRDLLWDSGRTCGRARPLEVRDDDHDWYRAGEGVLRELVDFSAVIMRKDPPFDMEYVYSTYLLEAAEREGARVFNQPRGIRDYNEKFAIADFPEFIAPTLVTRDGAHIGEFIDEHRDVIVKPLDGMGGTSVFRVRESDPNRNVIVETVSQFGARTVMAQRFIPAPWPILNSASWTNRNAITRRCKNLFPRLSRLITALPKLPSAKRTPMRPSNISNSTSSTPRPAPPKHNLQPSASKRCSPGHRDPRPCGSRTSSRV